MNSISTLEDIKESMYFIFKHSSTCPISASANKAVTNAIPCLEIPVYRIVVQDNRDLSAQIARTFGVVHESPQIILIKDGKAVWDESHYGIASDTLVAVAERHSG